MNLAAICYAERAVQGIVMTKREYLENAAELARRCILFAEKICRDWKEETPADVPTWDSPGEMRELYYDVLTLRHAAEVVLQRARLSNTSVCRRRDANCNMDSVTH
jgi:hypothetical protein